ncbi:MAG TPA: SEC-C metal-binding domain-containing protein [Myxococcaceae bacterium]|nr:SEC-C metal-binding domain-containing protein [Myxococcaceae bacterium]
MSRARPGRNEPCPCGSGKKYKVCHAAEDRARAAAQPAVPARPLAEDLRAAMVILHQQDVPRLTAALERLRALLTEWGPAPGLRFDEAAFDAHVTGEFSRLAEAIERQPAQARHELHVSTLRDLGTRAFLEKLRATLLARASVSGLSAEDRQALCVGALLATTTPGTRVQPEDRPVLDVLFDVQVREWGARQQEDWRSKLEALSASTGLSDEALEALMKASEGDVDALVQYVEADPALAGRIAQEGKERAARVEAALRQPSTPPVFAPEEQVWLTAVLWEPLRTLKARQPDASTRAAAVSSFLRAAKAALEADPEFLASLLERMRARAQDASLEEAARAFYTDAAVAFEAEPVRLVLAAILTSRAEPPSRSPEEAVVRADLEALPAWKAEDLEPYRQLLEAMQLPGPAERLRRAQAWLREHPISQ